MRLTPPAARATPEHQVPPAEIAMDAVEHALRDCLACPRLRLLTGTDRGARVLPYAADRTLPTPDLLAPRTIRSPAQPSCGPMARVTQLS